MQQLRSVTNQTQLLQSAEPVQIYCRSFFAIFKTALMVFRHGQQLLQTALGQAFAF